MTSPKKILFVCKYNRFRSQIAENYFNQINKNSNVTAVSAGLFQGAYPLDQFQKRVLKKEGIILGKRPQGMSSDLLKTISHIIIVANDVPKEIFLYKGKYLQRVTVWKIPDVQLQDEEKILLTAKEIKKRVNNLVKTY